METENRKDEIEIDLKGLFYALLGKLPIIILIGIVMAAVVFGASKCLITPKYQAKTNVYILSKTTDNDRLSASDMVLATYLVQDYQVLLTSEPVLSEVIDSLGISRTTNELAGMISVEMVEESHVMQITVTSDDAKEAKKIADKVRDVANEKTKDVMEGIQAVNAIDEAKLPLKPSSPNIKKNTMLGFLAGVGIAIAVIAILFILDDTIKTTEDVENYLGISVLSSIPLKDEQAKKKKKKNRKHSA